MRLFDDEKIELIKEQFHEKRELKKFDDTDYYITNDGELIVLDLHFGIFNEEVLNSKAVLAEKLYYEYGMRVNIYVLSDGCVCVREHSIPSFADFTIKLSVINNDLYNSLLNQIKNKFIIGDFEDLKFIGLLSLLTE